VLRPKERNPTLTPGAYEPVCEDGKMATCLREATFSLRRHFGEGGERRWPACHSLGVSWRLS